MKRSKEENEEENDSIHVAACLMLLSRVQERQISDQVFKCRSCDRVFSSFQALGGHRASHKPRHFHHNPTSSTVRPKMHVCSVCGVEFPIGQALGGHMRRHRYKLQDDPLSSEPILKRRVSRRALHLDLNLPPPENDLKFRRTPPKND